MADPRLRGIVAVGPNVAEGANLYLLVISGHEPADLVDKLSLDEMHIGVRQANIGKDVAAASFVADPLFPSLSAS